MIQIFRKPGFILNPSDKIVNAILKRVELNDGKCPCVHPENDGDLHCPCESYRERGMCYCTLYLKNASKN